MMQVIHEGKMEVDCCFDFQKQTLKEILSRKQMGIFPS